MKDPTLLDAGANVSTISTISLGKHPSICVDAAHPASGEPERVGSWLAGPNGQSRVFDWRYQCVYVCCVETQEVTP